MSKQLKSSELKHRNQNDRSQCILSKKYCLLFKIIKAFIVIEMNEVSLK